MFTDESPRGASADGECRGLRERRRSRNAQTTQAHNAVKPKAKNASTNNVVAASPQGETIAPPAATLSNMPLMVTDETPKDNT